MAIRVRPDQADRVRREREQPQVRVVAARAAVRGEAGAAAAERGPVASGPAEREPAERVLELVRAAPASRVRREQVEVRLDQVAVPAHGTAAGPEERRACREPMRVAM